MAEVLVIGKKISEMGLVTNISGNEKIPTGVVGDKAVTTGQLVEYLNNNGRSVWGRIDGDITEQTDLQNQFTQERNTLMSYTQEEISQQQEALQDHVNTTNGFFEYIRSNGAALPYKEDTSYEEEAVVVKDGLLQQLKGSKWKSVVAGDLTDTTQTFNTPEAGVDPVTGVDDGNYFNVRSTSEGSYVDEYQNIGGVPTPSGKSSPSSSAVQEIREDVEDLTKSTAYFHPTVAAMIADETLTDGKIVATKGYYNISDDGGAIYLISSTPTGYSIPLNNGLHAVFRDTFDIRKFGIRDDAELNQATEIERMIAYADSRLYEIDFLGFKILNPKTYYKTTPRGTVLRGMVFRHLHKIKNLHIINNKNETLVQGVNLIIFAFNNPAVKSKHVLENVTLDPYVADFSLNTGSSSGEFDGFMHGIHFDKTPTWSYQNANNIDLEFKNVNFVSSAQSYNISAGYELYNSVSFNDCGGEHLMLYSSIMPKNFHAKNIHTVYRDDLYVAGRSRGSAVFHVEPENHSGEPINLGVYHFDSVTQKIKSQPTSRGAILVAHLIQASGEMLFESIKVNGVTDALLVLYGGTDRRISVDYAEITNNINTVFHVHGKVRKTVYDNTDIHADSANTAFVLNGGERDYVEINRAVIYDALAVTGQTPQSCKKLVCNQITVRDETYGLMRSGTTPETTVLNDVTLMNKSARLIETSIESTPKSIVVNDLKIPNVTDGLTYGNVIYLRNANITCDVNNVICSRSPSSGYLLLGQALRVSLRNTISPDRFRLLSTEFTIFDEVGVFPARGASKTWDFPSLGSGAIQSTTLTVSGAKLGDAYSAVFSQPLLGSRLWAEVTAENTVTVYQHNLTPAPVDVASGILTVRAIQ